MSRPPPSMRRRLGRALLVWSVAWSVGVAIAVTLAARGEVEELLDDTLVAAAELLAALLPDDGAGLRVPDSGHSERFAWQVVAADGRLLLRSNDAPPQAFHPATRPGFSDAPLWRIYGLALGDDGRMLYVAQTREERGEAQYEVALTAVLAALAIGLLGQLWLSYRVRQELVPLRTLSQRLARYEPSDAAATLGEPERQEFVPMHRALHDLGGRLRERLDNERAFSAHAAHALRTPLAGIDAQLAVALEELPPALQPRLRRVRDAAGRLQRVVASLIGLFRSGTSLRRGPHGLEALLQRLPVAGLAVRVEPPDAAVDADPDLLSAALANLLDNASRQGATQVRIVAPTPTCVRVFDDGPGVDAARRDELQQLLTTQRYEAGSGLGLMLADRVARAHGGALTILAVERGFGVELRLGP